MAAVEENGVYQETTPPPARVSSSVDDLWDSLGWTHDEEAQNWYNSQSQFWNGAISQAELIREASRQIANLKNSTKSKEAREWLKQNFPGYKDNMTAGTLQNYANEWVYGLKQNFDNTYKAYGLNYADVDTWKEAWENQVKNYASTKNTTRAAAEQVSKAENDARESTIANREASAKQAQAQARTQGMSSGLASSIGNAPLSGQQSANYGNNLGALKNLGQTTLNDYLQKMGYANALEQQAENMEKGSNLNVIGAALGGAGAGASIGASLFGGLGQGD